MWTRRALVPVVVALGVVGGVIALVHTRSAAAGASWIPDLAVGIAFLLAGLVIGRRPGAEIEGLLVAGVALAWFAGDLFASVPLLYRGVLVHAALAMPRGALRQTLARVLVIAVYVASVVPLLASNQWLTLVLALAVCVAAVLADGAKRQAGLLVGGLIGLGAVVHLVAPIAADTEILTVFEVALCAVAGALAAIQAAGIRRTNVADLVVQLGPQDALADLARNDPAVVQDPAFLAAVDAAERLLTANQRLRDELTEQIHALDASRRRLLTVQDDESARLEQRLQHGPVGRLDRIAASLSGTPTANPAAAASLDSARTQAGSTRADLAAISRGLFPSAVADGSLESALHSIAASSPVPVAIELNVSRVQPQVATTVYFVCAEAVANAVRHSGATAITIRVNREAMTNDATPNLVVVEVADNGHGIADVNAGTGLLGLRDRLSIADGVLGVDSSAEAGTRIRARIPDVNRVISAGARKAR
jgi:signal transduction histidine kinase